MEKIVEPEDNHEVMLRFLQNFNFRHKIIDEEHNRKMLELEL
jgi:hypothetical protein